MEYERALFGLYDRALDGIRLDNPLIGRQSSTRPSRVCDVILSSLLCLGLCIIATTVLLHVNYVDKAGCLEDAVLLAADRAGVLLPPLEKNATNVDNSVELPCGRRLPGDVILGINTGGITQLQYERGVTDGIYNASDFAPVWTFSFDPAVLLLQDRTRQNHDFTTVNVTLHGGTCFGNSLPGALLNVIGYDTVIINQIMFTFRSRGLLKKSNGDEWWWGTGSIPPRHGYNILDRFVLKTAVAFKSVIAFIVESTVTALIVRIIMTSGVAIMYPLFNVLEAVGLVGSDRRILALSYPWLGIPVSYLQGQGRSSTSFICGHLMSVVVYYSMYNACQIAWSEWLYDKSISIALEVWLFGVVLVWEYFSLLFVRSSLAIIFFPRLTALYFVLFHCYFYYYAYGFLALAAAAHWVLLLHAMLYTLIKLEVPALARGEVSFEHPRACHVSLPWPVFGAALPPSWSLFVPPNTRGAVNVYENIVPQFSPSLRRRRPAAPVDRSVNSQPEGGVTSPPNRINGADLEAG